VQRPTVFANSLAVVAAILYVLCRLLVEVAPGAFATTAQSWFHGLVISPEPWNGLDASSFVLGLLTFTVVSWLSAFMWATVYNKLAGTAA
jgi:hypothetical protein